MNKQLKEQVREANLFLYHKQLVSLTWGNVSGIDRKSGLVVIKPSGIPFPDLKTQKMVVVNMDGEVVEGSLLPSSDLPTHLELYRRFPLIGGISHTHSEYATMFAQACREIPCFGTTHADSFLGPVPVTRPLTEKEVAGDYEHNTGIIIVEKFETLDYQKTPSILVWGHGPFSWGKDPLQAVSNSLTLERVAKMAFGTLSLQKDQSPIPDFLLNKHHDRKHGDKAYYGQKKSKKDGA